MNNIDQKNNKDDQLPEDNELNTEMESYTLQTEHENYAGNIQKDIATNENTPASGNNVNESLTKGQAADSGFYPVNQDKNKIEQIGVGSNKNMSIYFDQKMAGNELNDINSASVVQSVGHLLRRARTARGMSIDDVSRQLRLSTQQIEAIEKENFEKLPGRTFLRGFIRNYANLVQLDPIPLLQLIPESTPVISTYERTPFKNSQISFSSNREGSGSNQLVIVIILFIIILGAYFIFENNSWNKKPDNNSINKEVKVDAETTSKKIQLPLPTN